jgi:hypothetical protein
MSSFESRRYQYDGMGLQAIWATDIDEEGDAISVPAIVYLRNDSGLDPDEIIQREQDKAFTAALPIVRAQLAGAVMEWVRRVAPVDTVAAGILFDRYSSRQVPPMLGVLTQRQLRKWKETLGPRELRELVWRPADYEVFDYEPVELVGDDELGRSLEILGEVWDESDDHQSVRRLLRKVVRELRVANWEAVFEKVPVFFAIDSDIEDLDYVRRTAVDAKSRRRLESK